MGWIVKWRTIHQPQGHINSVEARQWGLGCPDMFIQPQKVDFYMASPYIYIWAKSKNCPISCYHCYTCVNITPTSPLLVQWGWCFQVGIPRYGHLLPSKMNINCKFNYNCDTKSNDNCDEAGLHNPKPKMRTFYST